MFYFRSMGKIFSFTISLFLGLFFYFSPTQALTISPAKIILSADPGETVEVSMFIRNDLEKTLTFSPAYEGYKTRGGAEPVFFKQNYGLSTWMETVPAQVNLGYKEWGQITVKINVPEDAEPGGHYAVIFWSSRPAGEAGTGVSIVTRVGALVLLDVSGEVVEAGKIVSFETSKKFFTHLPIIFTYDLKNEGTVHLIPEGKVVIKNIIGRTSAIIEVNPAATHVLPGDTRTFYTAYWEPEGGMPNIEGEGFFPDLKRELKGFALGYYRANLNLEYGKEEIKTLQASFGFWVFPWRVLVLSILILGILLFGVTKGIQKYNEWVINKVEERLRSRR